MHYVVEKTVKSQCLKEIIDFCIREKTLSHVTLWGLSDNEAHATMDLSIDYDRTGSHIKVASAYPVGAFYAPPADGTTASSGAPTPSENDLRPIWSEAIDWFVQLLEEKKLRLHWTVRFRDRDEEMCEKFGLVPATHTDKTKDCPSHTIPNSVIPEFMLNTRFSGTMFPEDK
ncbi:MAG: hypothetical protein KAY37_11645 [Phycisphaerae bacterium]|nr:hypothetical protein [Phycisphaerae bacterium]